MKQYVIVLIMILLILTACTQIPEDVTKASPPDSTSTKKCLADAVCFINALNGCNKAEYAECMFGQCAKAAIIGTNIQGECIVRNWAEDMNGNVINFDKQCFVPKDYFKEYFSQEYEKYEYISLTKIITSTCFQEANK